MLRQFLMTATLIELTPGPNMAWLALLGASRGRVVALAAVAGVALGLSIAGAAAALGVSAFIGKTPQMFQALRWAGSIYLIFLAWDALTASSAEIENTYDKPVRRYFLQGMGSNVLNPKAYLVYAVVLPQFVTLAKPVLPQLALLTVLYVLVATMIHFGIAILAGSFNAVFNRPLYRVWINRCFAGLLALVAIWFFYSTGLKS